MGTLAATFGSPRRLSLAERLAGLAGRVVGRRGTIGRLPLPGMLGAWFRSRDLRAPARTSFRRWWERTAGGSR
jgi:L-lactate dehydrogenase complex protein LldF